MEQSNLELAVRTFLASIGPDEDDLTSKEVLECALDIDLVDRSDEAKALFRMLRRLANGPLAPFVTRGPVYEVRGQKRRSYIWHSRPQSLDLPPTPLIEPQGDAAILTRLMRIEEKLDRLLDGRIVNHASIWPRPPAPPPQPTLGPDLGGTQRPPPRG